MDLIEDIRTQAGLVGKDVIGYRRHLHMHPETGFDTQETERFVKQILEGERIEILPSSVGVIGKISAGTGKKAGYIALRADMDALPLEEANDVPYRSRAEGKMHACGHDGHTAMLLGAATVLQRNREKLPRDVLLIFQPAEEGPKLGGARIMLKDLESMGLVPETRAMAALHLTTEHPAGTVAVRYGSSMASTDEFDIGITGLGGHGGSPHKAIDALSLAARFVTEMESFMSRRIDPLDSAVFAIGVLKAGTAANIIPERATLSGTLRCQREETRGFILSGAEKHLQAICSWSGAAYTMDVRRGLPVLVNDDEKVEQAERIAAEIVGADKVIRLKYPSMGAEDFAYFSEKIPAVFTWIGARNEEKGFVHMMHNPRFDFDEDALAVGTEMLCRIAVEME